MTASAPREFRVRSRPDPRHHARVVMEASFEAAAVAYLEIHPVEAPEDLVVSIIVEDLASGLEHCFRVDLSTGETAPCS